MWGSLGRVALLASDRRKRLPRRGVTRRSVDNGSTPVPNCEAGGITVESATLRCCHRRDPGLFHSPIVRFCS